MTEFKRLPLPRFPQIAERETPEGRFWGKFQVPVLQMQSAPVTSISFNPTAPHDFAVTTGTRVAMFSSKTNKATRAITRFRSIARCGTFRSDGKLLVAGSDEGPVQVFDTGSKNILRVFTGHRGPVHYTAFSPDKTHVLTASDDKTVRYWDVTSGECVAVLSGHTDYVRTGVCVSGSSSLWATGSYDHTIKLWDCRPVLTAASAARADDAEEGEAEDAPTPSVRTVGGLVMTLDHGRPVSAVLALPGGAAIASAGGNVITIWDVLAGGKLVHTFSNHQKSITALCLDGTGTRLLSASLDCHVKVYDLQSYDVVFGVKYPAPILSLAIAPDNSRLVVGMTDCMLSIKQRVVKAEESFAVKKRAVAMRGGTYRYFLRGKSSSAAAEDFQVEARRKTQLRPYESFLKAFQYKNALNAALETRDPLVVVSLIEELRQRDGLQVALAGRDETTLEPLVAFVAKYITHPRYSSLLITISNALFDMYAPLLGQSFAIDQLFLRLQARVKEEITLQKHLCSLLGALDLVMASATTTHAE